MESSLYSMLLRTLKVHPDNSSTFISGMKLITGLGAHDTPLTIYNLMHLPTPLKVSFPEISGEDLKEHAMDLLSGVESNGRGDVIELLVILACGQLPYLGFDDGLELYRKYRPHLEQTLDGPEIHEAMIDEIGMNIAWELASIHHIDPSAPLLGYSSASAYISGTCMQVGFCNLQQNIEY